MKDVKCNLCGNSNCKKLLVGQDRQHKIDKQKFNIVKCLSCGLVYINPQPVFEELKKYYPKDYKPYSSEDTTFKYGSFSKLFKKISNNKSEIKNNLEDIEVINYLDFGCGNGSRLERVRNKHPYWKLFGLDNNEFACKLTQDKKFNVYCGNITEVKLPDNYFDIINLTQVIEHLNDPYQALEILFKSLKKGGQIIIQTPNINSFSAKLFRSFWYALDVPRHLYLFSNTTLSNLLNKTKFIIKKIEYKESLMVEIKSFFYLFNKKDLRINPFCWKLLIPISKLLKFIKQSSIITIYAEKK